MRDRTAGRGCSTRLPQDWRRARRRQERCVPLRGGLRPFFDRGCAQRRADSQAGTEKRRSSRTKKLAKGSGGAATCGGGRVAPAMAAVPLAPSRRPKWPPGITVTWSKCSPASFMRNSWGSALARPEILIRNLIVGPWADNRKGRFEQACFGPSFDHGVAVGLVDSLG